MNRSLNFVAQSSDNYNNISRAIWYIVFALVLLCEFGLLNDDFYRGRQEWFWFVGVLSFFVGFIVPCRKVIKDTRSVVMPLVLSALWLIQCCAMVLYYGYEYIPHDSQGIIFRFDHLVSIMTSLFAVSAIVIGWFVHDYSQKNSLRRQHTVNVLNSSRMSAIYVEKQHEYELMFSAESVILKEHVDLYFNWRKNKDKAYSDCKADKEKEEKTITSMRAALYLMNHHEFVCAGINNDDLDESYIVETMSYLTVSLYDACKEFIHEIQKANPDCFKHMSEMAGKWRVILETNQ